MFINFFNHNTITVSFRLFLSLNSDDKTGSPSKEVIGIGLGGGGGPNINGGGANAGHGTNLQHPAKQLAGGTTIEFPSPSSQKRDSQKSELSFLALLGASTFLALYLLFLLF